MQYLSFMRARPGRDAQAFQQWYLTAFAPRVAGSARGLGRQVVNLTVAGPDELKLAHDSPDPLARYDVVAEMEFPSTDAFRAGFGAAPSGELAEWADVQNNYRVSDTVMLDGPKPGPEVKGPRYKLLRELIFFDDLSDRAAKRLWAHHAKLALKVHVGMYRYVQHWIEERIGPGAEAYPVRGVSELCFPNREVTTKRYYESDRGREEILHDTGHFIQRRLPRVYGNEYVVGE